MRRKAQPSPLQQKSPKRTLTLAATPGPRGTASPLQESAAADDTACAGCKELKTAVSELRASLTTMAGLRAEADTLHQRSVAESEQRDQESAQLILQLREEIARLQQTITDLQQQQPPPKEEDDDMEEEEDSSPPPPPPPQTPLPPPPPPQTPKSAAKSRVSMLRMPSFVHTPVSSMRKPVRGSIARPSPPPSPAVPPPPPTPKPTTTTTTAASDEDVNEDDAKQLELYRLLTGLRAHWDSSRGLYTCTFSNADSGRGIEFELVVGDSSCEYTPLRIDDGGEPGAFSEVVTDAIEFDRDQLPVFLGKLIEELYA